MAKLKNLIFCESYNVNTLPDGTTKTVINHPLISIKLAYIPSLFSFSIVLCLEEMAEDAVIRVVFKNKEINKILFDSDSLPLSVRPREKFHGEIIVGMSILNMPVENDGLHVSEIFIDGILIEGYPMVIRRDENVC